MYIYIIYIYKYIHERRTRLYVNLTAMHKLGSSPIGCEDFSVRGGITNGGLV